MPIISSAQKKDFLGADGKLVFVISNDSANIYELNDGLGLTTTAPIANEADTISILDSLANYKANLEELPDTGWVNRNDIYVYNDKVLRIIQPHERYAVAHFDPESVPALYMFRELGCAEWVQPTGGHDAYNIGDCVIFGGQEYESLINANVWSPAVYPAGWELR